MRLLPFALLLAGCAATEPGAVTRERQGLERDLAKRTAGEARSCLSMTRSSGLRVVDPGTLVYREGSTLWVNRLAAECPGLRPLATLIVRSQGGQTCRGDQVSSIEPGSSIPGPTCILGDFTPYRIARAR